MKTPPLLTSLRDIHLPPPIPHWPIAIGWLLLGGLFILLALVGGWLCYSRYHKRRKQKAIWERFYHLQAALQQQTSPTSIIYSELAALLKQVAIAYYPAHQPQSLQGFRWLHFLDTTGKTHDFTKGKGRLLLTLPYRSKHHPRDKDVFIVIERWLRTCL